MNKKCRVCNEKKPDKDFAKSKMVKSGLSSRCKSCESKRGIERYKKIKEKAKKQAAVYRINNYEKRIEIERKSRIKNKKKYRAKRNARQSIRNKVTLDKKYTILDKELNRIYSSPCFACGSLENQSLDHLIPLARGGTHSVGNIITLCLTCNMSKNKKTLTEWFKFKKMIGVD